MRIANYEPHHRDKLLHFLEHVLAGYPEKANPRYFDWMFSKNPLGSSLATYALLVDDADAIVGQIGTLRDRLRIAGRWVDSLWIIDLVIDPAFRGGVGARQLFKQAMKSAAVVMATGVAPRIIPIYRGLGWQQLSPVRARYHVLRPSRLLALAGGTDSPPEVSRPVRITLGIADPILRLAGRARARVRRAARRLVPGALRVDTVDRFEGAWDDDLCRLTEACGVTEYRNAALLNWKFVERPLGRHEVLAIRSPGGGLRAMMVIKWMMRPDIAQWLEVADYLALPDDAVGFLQLTQHVMSLAADAGLDFVRFRLAHPAHVPLLRPPMWLDYTRPSVDDVFVFTKDEAIMGALRSSPWHLTALASDRIETGRDEWQNQDDGVPAPLSAR